MRIELITLVVLTRQIRTIFQLIEETQVRFHSMIYSKKQQHHSSLILSYLQSLDSFYLSPDPSLLKSLLSQVHHILAQIPCPSLLHTVICAAIPLPSVSITKRVVSNCCMIPNGKVDAQVLRTLLRVITDGDNWTVTWSTATGMIFHGLEGNEEDQNKSIRLACAAVEGCSNPDMCGEFVIKFLHRLVEVLPVASRGMNHQLTECILMSYQLTEDWIDRLLWSLKTILESFQDPRILTHTIDLILSLSSHISFYVVFASFFCNLIRSKLASSNRDPFLHARLLRLMALLLPLIDLQPVLRPNSWLYQKWQESKNQLEKEEIAYNTSIHRIPSFFTDNQNMTPFNSHSNLFFLFVRKISFFSSLLVIN